MEPPFRASLLATGLLVASFASAAEAQVTHPFPGVTLVRNPSRAMAVVNLCAAGVSVRATQYAERMATPQQWAEPRGLEVAINADFFDFPGWTYVVGRARGQGHDWPAADQNREARPYWQFGPHMAVETPNGATAPDPAATDIVGGHDVLMSGGHSSGPWTGDSDLLNTAHNRTAIGISADHLTLFLLSTNEAIDAATTVTYLIHDAAEAGSATVDYATMQDGGGSSQMYVAGLGQIVTSGRQVNNHLGIDANGGMGVPTNCTAHYAAVFHAQSFPYAAVGPVMVAVGQDSAQWIELTNAGTLPWIPGQTFLAPTPRDMPSAVGGAAWVSPTRVSTVTAMVPPGGVYRFPLVFTGTRTGDFTQTFGMVQEGVTWFSTAPLGGGPPDDQIEAHVVVTPGTLDAGGPDVAMPDAGREPLDAEALPDGFVSDAGGRDARVDGGLGAEGSEHADGCGCRTRGARGRGDGAGWVALGLAAACALRRRRG